MTLFFSSLPSAPTRIPRPHNWLKTDRKQFTVWYSGSVYPRYVWATHRLCIIRNRSAKFNRAGTKSRRFMKNFRSLFCCLNFKSLSNRKRKNFNLSMKFLRRSQWLHSLRRGSVNARLLGLRVRIPPGARMSLESVACCQEEVFASGRSLVRRSPTKCGVYSFIQLEISCPKNQKRSACNISQSQLRVICLECNLFW
jgi:hypothetical protein